jgi:hypothetical protein
MPLPLPIDSPAEPVQVLEPKAEAAPERRTILHPAAGGLILGLDWLLFSGTAATMGLATPLSASLGFVVGSIGTAAIQRKLAGDSRTTAALKGLAAGVVVGVPFPIAGTAVGGGILVLSGLDRLLKRKLDRSASR